MEILEKKETLSRLYALRVGLALLSAEKNEYDKCQEEKNKENALLSGKKSNACNKVNQNKETIKEKRDALTREENYMESVGQYISQSCMKCFGAILAGVLLLVACFVLGYYSYLFFAIDMGGAEIPQKLEAMSQHQIPLFALLDSLYITLNNLFIKIEEGSFWWGVMAILYVVVVMGGTISSIIFSVLWFKRSSQYSRQAGEYIKQKGKKPAIIQTLKNEIATLESQNKTTETSLQYWKDKNGEEVERIEEEMEEILQDFWVLYNAYEKEYSDFLNPLDWGNVDLMIYYFQTGRADSMKEALLLVDEQRRHEMLKEAIYNASSQICSTLDNGFREMQDYMADKFASLSQQISSMKYYHQEQLNALNAKMQALSTNVSANVVVREKANVNSLQLADDIRYLRVVAENEEIRRRNNL